jgi:hypothetical protein
LSTSIAKLCECSRCLVFPYFLGSSLIFSMICIDYLDYLMYVYRLVL